MHNVSQYSTSQPGETGLGPHTPSTCAGMCNQLLLLLLLKAYKTPPLIGGSRFTRRKASTFFLSFLRLVVKKLKAASMSSTPLLVGLHAALSQLVYA